MSHTPVMLNEVIQSLIINKSGCYIDGTIGGGGHLKEILKKIDINGKILGFDRDIDAIARVKEICEKDSRFQSIHLNFCDIPKKLDQLGIKKVDGVLLDLGVSSFQIDISERGFSFSKDSTLDMRMDQSQKLCARKWINSSSEKEIAEVIYKYGNEPKARKIANSIIQYRKNKDIIKTTELAELILKVKANEKFKKIHPATKSFQAIRIKINNELESLEKVLSGMIHRVSIGGRFVILTFHSLEDRIVKHFFNTHLKRKNSLQEGGYSITGLKPYIKWISKNVITASSKEVEQNPRSRSAKLRVIEIIG